MAKKEEVIPPSYRVYIDTSQAFSSEPNGADSIQNDFVDQIMTSVPEDGVNMTTSSNFDAPLSEGASSINTFAQAFDYDFSNNLKAFGKQIWQGSEPLEIDLNMNFVTVESPYRDVVQPAITMLAVPLPESQNEKGEERWTLGSPVLPGERGLAVKISRMNFPFVYPLNVDVNWSKTYCREPGVGGISSGGAWPVSAEVQFSFLANPVPTRSDIGFELEGTGSTSTDLEANV
jgi:hypothetical protein